ncbi:MAG: hypothetical protein AAFW67_07865 [Cyanobacteria bacterium J06638_38]
MIYKSLLKVFLTSVGLFGALTTAVAAQERPECYIIDNSGRLTDLTDLCNVSQGRSPGQDSANIEPLNIDDNPECYLIDNAGKLTDLTDLCNVSQGRSPGQDSANSEPLNVDNNDAIAPRLQSKKLSLDNNQYILGENKVATESGSIDSSYYIDNAIGSNYAAYVRRYKNAPTSIARQTLREQLFQLNPTDSTPDRLTSILRQGREIPFIIYRY